MKKNSCPPRKLSLEQIAFIDEIAHFVELEMFRLVDLELARRWIADHLRPQKHPHRLGLYFWKHEFEQAKRPYRYITARAFAELLTAAGFRVVGDRVYCREVRNGK